MGCKISVLLALFDLPYDLHINYLSFINLECIGPNLVFKLDQDKKSLDIGFSFSSILVAQLMAYYFYSGMSLAPR